MIQESEYYQQETDSLDTTQFSYKQTVRSDNTSSSAGDTKAARTAVRPFSTRKSLIRKASATVATTNANTGMQKTWQLFFWKYPT